MDTLPRSWLRLRHGNRAIVCDRCGEVSPMPENFSIDQFITIAESFADRHLTCEREFQGVPSTRSLCHSAAKTPTNASLG